MSRPTKGKRKEFGVESRWLDVLGSAVKESLWAGRLHAFLRREIDRVLRRIRVNRNEMGG
jgi:hypothetical protein